MTASVELDFHNSDGERIAVTDRFLRLLLRAPFGAERARLWVDLTPDKAVLPIAHNTTVQVTMDGAVRFRGRIHDIRTDTGGVPLAFRAVRDPQVLAAERVNGIYVNQSPTVILEEVLANIPSCPLVYSPSPVSGVVVDRLEFTQAPVFHVIDLLAKLAGNWLWDIDWDWNLRFRPHEPEITPDHVLYFDDRFHVFTIWETQRFLHNVFRFYGGVVGGNAFERGFLDEASVSTYGARDKSLFARAIRTDGAYGLLRDAVLAQLPHPVNEKYLTLHEDRHDIGPGDVLELRGTGLRTFETDPYHRVAEQEIRVNNAGEMRVRLTLAQKWESSSRYHRYIDHDYFEDPLNYVRRRVGPFELDWSALDSEAGVR